MGLGQHSPTEFGIIMKAIFFSAVMTKDERGAAGDTSDSFNIGGVVKTVRVRGEICRRCYGGYRGGHTRNLGKNECCCSCLMWPIYCLPSISAAFANIVLNCCRFDKHRSDVNSPVTRRCNHLTVDHLPGPQRNDATQLGQVIKTPAHQSLITVSSFPEAQ